MKVKELIKILREMDQDTRIVINGYEGGYNDISSDFEIKTLSLNVNSAWYYGKHEATEYVKNPENYNRERAYILN